MAAEVKAAAGPPPSEAPEAAAPAAGDAPAAATDGAAVGEGSLAEGLVQAVSSSGGVGPEEDVAAYLQGCLLPTLAPVIEQLLHHVHESGELQRALKEMAAAEKSRATASRRGADSSGIDAAKGDRASSEDAGESDKSPSNKRGRGGRHGSEARPSGSKDPSKGPKEEEEEVDAFDPLIWLSERLRESASGPTDRYREQIEKRVIQSISEAEKAILEGNEDESAEPAAVTTA